MNAVEKANKIGFEAAISGGECVPAFNKELMELISDQRVGGGSAEIMKSFNEGVWEGVECRAEMN